MNHKLIAAAGDTPSLRVAKTILENNGFAFTDHPHPETTHLLLNVPSFTADGALAGGGELSRLLPRLPEAITVIGGNLTAPELSGYTVIDLLRDDGYLAKNADITARCALRVASATLPCTWDGCPVLVIGWGRIGKCLAKHLSALGADVTVAARKSADRAMLRALGYAALPIRCLHEILPRCRVIYNTVPAPVLSQAQSALCRKDCLKIELASVPGIAGEDVVMARGLPGKLAPEDSGKLIAQTVLRLMAEKEELP